jgi:hypothetical protein
MRMFALGLVVSLAAAASTGSLAQSPPSGASTKSKEVLIGPIPAPSSPPPADNRETCIEVEIDGTRTFNCTNEKLKRDAERVVPQANVPPLDARSPDVKLGIINIPAVKQQYGPNYGVSVIPYRPPLPVYSPPLHPK